MLVELENVSLTNVWKEQFTRRDSGEVIDYFRALLNKAGEAPFQVGVSKEDEPSLTPLIGSVGTAVLNIDARPGERVRLFLKSFED